MHFVGLQRVCKLVVWVCECICSATCVYSPEPVGKHLYLKGNIFSCPRHLPHIYLHVSWWVLGRKWIRMIPLHGGGLRQTQVARFNGGGSWVKGASRFHICNFAQILSGLLSKWAASRTLMCISKTKGEKRGGHKMGFDFSEIYGRDEISFE